MLEAKRSCFLEVNAFIVDLKASRKNHMIRRDYAVEEKASEGGKISVV